MRPFALDDVEVLVCNEYMQIEIFGLDLMFTTDLHCEECCPPEVRLPKAHKETDRCEKFSNHFESVFSLEGCKLKIAPHIEWFNNRGWRMDDNGRVRCPFCADQTTS